MWPRPLRASLPIRADIDCASNSTTHRATIKAIIVPSHGHCTQDHRMEMLEKRRALLPAQPVRIAARRGHVSFR